MVEGNYVIGLIVFLILVVVQYVVVTNGAQRVAEVAARFTLDSMPGQQMSIDADLNMGLIDQAEAKRRRKNLEKEANFYGAMDGASKFVKGDAIAGIVIVLINIIGGLAIGVTQHGMPWAEALQTYTLLTIGDGIVTQIPALVISVGAGIIITRSASDARLSCRDREADHQLSAHAAAGDGCAAGPDGAARHTAAAGAADRSGRRRAQLGRVAVAARAERAGGRCEDRKGGRRGRCLRQPERRTARSCGSGRT